MNWLNFPVDFSSQVQVVAFHIADMEKFEKVRDGIFDKLKEDTEWLTEREYRGSTYWTESDDSRAKRDEAQLKRRKRWARRNGRDPDEIELAGGKLPDLRWTDRRRLDCLHQPRFFPRGCGYSGW